MWNILAAGFFYQIALCEAFVKSPWLAVTLLAINASEVD
jgi:hypothetical protein